MIDEDQATAEKARRRVLERLFWLRNLVVIAQIAVVLLVVYALGISLFLTPLLEIIAALWVWNLLTGWRLAKPLPVTAGEIAVNLAVDTVALAGLLYWSGGSTNPFVSLFLVPVALAAAFLPVRYVVMTVALAAGLYTLLLWQYVPLAPVGSRFGGDFNLHIWGMWASFIMSAIIAAVFVYNLANAGRRRERELGEAHEKLARNEYIVSAGALAAGAAHEMNTPLSTVSLLADEIQEIPGDVEQVRSNAGEILNQVEHCKRQLQKLQNTASGEQEAAYHETDIGQVVDNWAALRPDVVVYRDIHLAELGPDARLDGLAMALTNLLDNAADASVEQGVAQVRVSAKQVDGDLCVEIDDFGKGLSPDQLKQAGRKPFTSKQNGLGMGLVLSHASLDRLGGQLTMFNRKEGGMRTRIQLPLAGIQ